MSQLFQASPFPLSAAGGAAQALANSGDLAEAGQGLGDLVSHIKTQKMLNTKLSDLGFDDQHALLAGATPQPLPATVIPGATGPAAPPVVLPPSAMTVRQLMLRKQAAGAQADQATAPTLSQAMNGAPPASLSSYADTPLPVVKEVAPLAVRAVPQGQMYSTKAQIDAFSNGGPLPKFSFTPTGAADEQMLDKSHYKILTEMNASRRLDNAAVSPEDRKLITTAYGQGLIDPTLYETMLSRPEGAKQLADFIRSNPGKNFTEQAIQTKAAVADATGGGRVKGQNRVMATAGKSTVDGILDGLEANLKNLDQSDLAFVNKGDIAALQQLNKPEATQFVAGLYTLAHAQAQAGHVGLGPASPSEVKVWQDKLTSGLSSGGLAGVRKAMDIANTSQVKSFGGGNSPAVGTVKGGYKFNGGDPSNKNNWTKN